MICDTFNAGAEFSLSLLR